MNLERVIDLKKKKPLATNTTLKGVFRVCITLGMLSVCFAVPCIVFADHIQTDQSEPESNSIGSGEIPAPPLVSSRNSDTTDVIMDSNPSTLEWKVVRMRVTAYCSCSQCCGAFADGITACNHHIQDGDRFVAADKNYSFGTKMLIPGYNNEQPVEVKDRGGAIRGERLDVFFNSHQEALQWGVQYLDVLIQVP